LGVQSRVTFLGRLSDADLLPYFHACDILALPSVASSEMFGIVQLEAMACRKPVLASNLPTGVSWINQEGITGFLPAPGNVAEWIAAIAKLEADAGLRRKMGEAGRRRVEDHFTAKTYGDKVLEVYEEVLGKKNQPARAG
jgi:glycosyltransferase involved in cell wall biosynthesis